MIRRLALLSGFAALGLMAVGTVAPASAGQQKIYAPVHQTATAKSRAKFGDATSIATNQNLSILDVSRDGGRGRQVLKAPVNQHATAKSFAIHGDATSVASNNNTTVATVSK